jgi:hypothetical protein
LSSIQETKITMEDCGVIMMSGDAESLLGVSPPIDPQLAQEKIDRVLQEVFSGGPGNPPTSELAASLGAFWGNTLTQAYDWDWVAVVNGDWRGLGVSDKARKFLVLPFNFFQTLIFNNPSRAMPGPAVLFKAIGANYLPESSPDQFLIIAE